VDYVTYLKNIVLFVIVNIVIPNIFLDVKDVSNNVIVIMGIVQNFITQNVLRGNVKIKNVKKELLIIVVSIYLSVELVKKIIVMII
jgi:hypothetical protein